MELQAEDGTTFPINSQSAVDIGRNLGLGFPTSSPADPTVSRRHLSLRLTTDPESSEPRVSFHVIGKNPILVRHEAGTRTERIYKNSSSGELKAGDQLSLSLKTPKFLSLKGRYFEMDISATDPVKEFGFIVKGHEFDQYPKGMMVGIRHWNWFLEEPKKNAHGDSGSDEEASRSRGKKDRRRRKGEGHGSDGDEEWSGESEEEKVLVVKGRIGKRPKYSTRSKDPRKPRKVVKAQKDEVEDEDEEDETLGGFIVDEEEVEEAEVPEEEESEEEEEELEEEDDDDDDE